MRFRLVISLIVSLLVSGTAVLVLLFGAKNVFAAGSALVATAIFLYCGFSTKQICQKISPYSCLASLVSVFYASNHFFGFSLTVLTGVTTLVVIIGFAAFWSLLGILRHFLRYDKPIGIAMLLVGIVTGVPVAWLIARIIW